MEVAQAFCSNELKNQSKENIKNVLEGFDMQKLKKIHKKAVKKDDQEIIKVVKTIVIERLLKNF